MEEIEIESQMGRQRDKQMKRYMDIEMVRQMDKYIDE